MKEPKIRFKGFQGEWEEKALGCCVAFLDSMRQPIEEVKRTKGIYPYYGASGVVDYINNYIFDEELLLLSEDGANITDRNYPICFIARGKYWVNNHAHVLKANNGFDNVFLCNNLERKDYTKYNTGMAMPKLNKEVCIRIPVFFPTLSEQQSIASYFQHLDSLIQSTTKKIESLKQVKAASLQSMFPQEGETTPRVRFKGFEGEWEKVLVGSLGTWSKGRLLSKSDLVDEGINPCIHYGELFVNYGEVINKVVSATNIETGCLSESGDILFPDSDVTPTGLARCSAIMLDGVILGGGINILRIGKNNYAPFVSYSINQEKEQIITRVTGTTVRHINAYALSEVIIKLPTDKEEQKRIAAYLQTLDHQINLQTQRLEKLKQIKAACLDKMFV